MKENQYFIDKLKSKGFEIQDDSFRDKEGDIFYMMDINKPGVKAERYVATSYYVIRNIIEDLCGE